MHHTLCWEEHDQIEPGESPDFLKFAPPVTGVGQIALQVVQMICSTSALPPIRYYSTVTARAEILPGFWDAGRTCRCGLARERHC